MLGEEWAGEGHPEARVGLECEVLVGHPAGDVL